MVTRWSRLNLKSLETVQTTENLKDEKTNIWQLYLVEFKTIDMLLQINCTHLVRVKCSYNTLSDTSVVVLWVFFNK